MNLSLKPGRDLGLPAEWYHRADMFERERQAVFAREWQFIGSAAALAHPGDYIATEIVGWRVFVIRDREGELRGFHNLCRHRAGYFLEDGQGHCDVLRCKYHGWVYDTKGRLRATPGFGEAGWFDKQDFPLLPIKVGLWRGLVFVNLDHDARPLESALGDLPELTAPYPVESFACLQEVQFDISCNWKTYTDNFVEGYHIPSIHPGLNAAIDFEGFETTQIYHFYFRDTGAEQAEARARTIETNCQIVREDFGICEIAQRNLEAGAFSRGPLSPKQEAGVRYFHDRLRGSLGPL